MSQSIIAVFTELYNEFAQKAFKTLNEDESYRQEAQLYHYTSLQSFQKMIENQSLRATSIYMLNDPNELIHGYENIVSWFPPDVSQKISKNPRYQSHYGFPAFVFSLTQLNDDMHFWEKYGNKHQGIRIGFTPENLVDYWRKLESVQVLLAPVIYSRHGRTFIGPYAEAFGEFRKKFIREVNNHFIGKEVSHKDFDELSYCTSLIASLIKREEWSLEKEWRVICIPQGFVHKAIIGDFQGGHATAKLERKSPDTLNILTNFGHDGMASKDVLKIGCNAGNKEFVEYTIKLLFKKATGNNFFNDVITQSNIVTR